MREQGWTDAQPDDIKRIIFEWVMPLPIDVLDGAVQKYLPSWFKVTSESVSLGSKVYRLFSRDLGSFGEILVRKRGENESEWVVYLWYAPPLRPNREELNQKRESNLMQIIELLKNRLADDESTSESLHKFMARSENNSSITVDNGDVTLRDKITAGGHYIRAEAGATVIINDNSSQSKDPSS